jgi:predicted transport protein
MEVAFGQEAYDEHFDSFMRHYLTVRTDEIPRIREVYEAFKNYAQSTEVKSQGVDALVADIHKYATHYCAMSLGREEDAVLQLVFSDLRELRVDVAFPLLLELYDDYTIELLSRDELAHAVRLVEAYVFRRAICSIPTNSLNMTFAKFSRSLKKENYLQSLQAHFLLLPSYRRFPSDEEFRRDLKHRDLYNFRSRSYWLRKLENYGRKERILLDEYTIEHIMPQNRDLSQEWRDALGEGWEQLHETWLHTLGNLTLTRYNSEYSDHPFAKKRDMDGGFRKSPLHLNEGLGQVQEWAEAEIRARADRLSFQAAKVWPSPILSADELESYRPDTGTSRPAYALADHRYLVESPHTRAIFDEFRREILALDPCVTEEYLKLYVAFKAETNFVDVVPQKSRLRVSINLRFNELQDARGIAKDVTGLGRWGNGDVELFLSSVDEIPYAMGLVRQALEKQMGNIEN